MITMSDQYEVDREWLIEIRTVLTVELINALCFEPERWRRAAINRELDRREALARELQYGKL